MRLTPLSPLAREFRERGFVVVRRLLPEATVEGYVRELERLSGRERGSFEPQRWGGLHGGWTLPDGVSKLRAFWDLACLPGLVDVVRDLLGPGARFLQHTDLHVGFSAVNWHRDCVNRRPGRSGDWDESEEPYRLARVGFYLQSHAESRFALGFVPGSHRRGGLLSETALDALERRTRPWRQAAAIVAGHDLLRDQAQWVAAESGDAVIFDPRILHSGSFIRGAKYSAFLAYGLRGRHFSRHLHYYRHVREELGYAGLDPAFVARLREAGLAAEAQLEASIGSTGAYRPGLVERLLGRRVRPHVAAG